MGVLYGTFLLWMSYYKQPNCVIQHKPFHSNSPRCKGQLFGAPWWNAHGGCLPPHPGYSKGDHAYTNGPRQVSSNHPVTHPCATYRALTHIKHPSLEAQWFIVTNHEKVKPESLQLSFTLNTISTNYWLDSFFWSLQTRQSLNWRHNILETQDLKEVSWTGLVASSPRTGSCGILRCYVSCQGRKAITHSN